MASLDLVLSAEVRPAFHALIATAQEICLTHGEEEAERWAASVLNRDFDLFIRTNVERPKPVLRLIAGGC